MLKTVALPSGERVPAFCQGTWTPAQLAELDRLFPPPAGPQPLEMLQYRD